MLSSQRRPEKTVDQGLIPKDLGDEYLFYDSRGDRVHVLNATARSIYMLCDGTLSEAEVADRFAAMYGIDGATAERDIEQTLGQLTEIGLLRAASAE